MDDRWWITTPSGRLCLINRKIETRPYTISANLPGRSGRVVLDEEPGKSGKSIEGRPGFRPRQADPWGAPVLADRSDGRLRRAKRAGAAPGAYLATRAALGRTEGNGSRPFISPDELGSVPTFDQREQARTHVYEPETLPFQ